LHWWVHRLPQGKDGLIGVAAVVPPGGDLYTSQVSIWTRPKLNSQYRTVTEKEIRTV